MKFKSNIITKSKGIFILFFLIITVPLLQSQDIKKDVTVVKPYQPSISDASKINQLPVFKDTVSFVPKFDYSISPIHLNTFFQPRIINAAKMAPEPLKFLYNNYIKLGFGNRLATLAEISIASNRSKKNSYGFYFNHVSAEGSPKLDNNLKVDAPFADNALSLYGRHIFKESLLSGNVGYISNKVLFYGYYPLLDTTLEKNNILQYYRGGNFNLALESLETDSAHFYYKFSGGYKYISDNYKNAENHVSLNGLGGKQYNEYYLGAEFQYNSFIPGANNDTIHNTVFTFKPYLSKSKGDWRFHLGLDFTNDNTEKGNTPHIYLDANLEFAIVKSVLHAYIGYDGFLEINNLSTIAQINPFIMPGLRLRNTDNNTHIFGGLKGSATANFYYSCQASYSAINDQYFFVNDSGILSNHFIAVYDDIGLLKFSTEFDIKASEKLSFLARGNYYIYSMNTQEKPWQMPNLDVTLTLKYNLQDQIILTTDICTVGRRFARDPKTKNAVLMNSFFDFNLGIEYRYTRILSFFLQFKNLTASRYLIWNQYPAYRFQVMAGLTYAL